MNSKNKTYKRYLKTGPGGLNCPCCGPAPKDRKFFFRLAKKQETRESYKFQEKLDELEKQN